MSPEPAALKLSVVILAPDSIFKLGVVTLMFPPLPPPNASVYIPLAMIPSSLTPLKEKDVAALTAKFPEVACP